MSLAAFSATAPAAQATPRYATEQADQWSAAVDASTGGLGITPAQTTGGVATPGITGDRVKVTDYEYGLIPTAASLSAPGSTISNETPSLGGDGHSTMVASIIAGVDTTGVGASGIAPGVNYSSHGNNLLRTGTPVATAAALLDAGGDTSRLGAGDVLLLEIQGPGGVSPETSPAIFDAIKTITARGVIVVEAAGNGDDTNGENYNEAKYSTWAQAADSGAIVVGAGNQQQLVGAATSPYSHVRCNDHNLDGTPAPSERLIRYSFSGYGARVDVQGPGCTPANDGGTHYEDAFGGTSGASAVIAGVVASLSSAYKAWSGGTPLTPAAAREALIATGTQPSPTAEGGGHIGPEVNLAGALAYLKATHNKPFVRSSGLPLRGTNGDVAIAQAVKSNGLATTTAVQYGTSTAYGTTVATQSFAAGAAGQATKTIAAAGLTAGTTYHYRFTATNGDGTSYGADQTFVARGATTKPVVDTTTDDTDEWRGTGGQYTLYGRVGSGGLTTSTSIEYKLSTASTYTSVATGTVPARESTPGAPQQQISTPTSLQLTTGATYDFRVVATNSLGSTTSDPRQVVVSSAAVVSTSASPTLAGGALSLSGVVYGNGSAGHATSIDWTTSTSFNALRPVYANHIDVSATTFDALETKTVSGIVTGGPTTNGTVIHYRLVATNYHGETRGPDQTFTVGAPTVSTASPEPTYSQSADAYTLSGHVDGNGASTTTKIQYGLNTAYSSTPLTTQAVAAGAGATVTGTLASIQTGTTIHYRTVATNTYGTSYGPDRSFVVGAPGVTTASAPPAYSQATDAYTLSGHVDASAASTTTKIQWGVGTNYSGAVITTQTVAAGTGAQVSGSLPSLQTGTTIHYRTVATNSYGTTYGPDQSFVIYGAPSVSADAAPVRQSNGAYTLYGKVDPGGLQTTTKIQYGTAASGYNWTITTATLTPGGSGIKQQVFGATDPSLTAPGTTYKYRVVATNALGTTNGPEQTFTAS